MLWQAGIFECSKQTVPCESRGVRTHPIHVEVIRLAVAPPLQPCLRAVAQQHLSRLLTSTDSSEKGVAAGELDQSDSAMRTVEVLCLVPRQETGPQLVACEVA
eukprot:5834487-Pleurochrysis_carterae.AAC.1